MRTQRSTLVLSNGMAGAEKQAVALAQAIGLPFSVSTRLPRGSLELAPTAALASLAGHDAGRRLLGVGSFAPPHPAVAVSCGRGSILASMALRASSESETLTVHIQRPACSESAFDLVVAPQHDYAETSPPANTLLTEGALHSITPPVLRDARTAWAAQLRPLPSPRLTVLLGGTVSRRWWQRPLAPEVSAEAVRALLHSAASAVAPLGGSVLVSTSRRTPHDARQAAAETLGEIGSSRGVPCRAWHPETPHNPYLGLLAWSDAILLTPDSVSMVSEACATTAPVYVHRPHDCRRRFRAFHERLLARGRTREWCGVLDGPLSHASADGSAPDVERAAARVRQMLDDRESARGASLRLVRVMCRVSRDSLAARPARARMQASRRNQPRQNVLYVVFDDLRADLGYSGAQSRHTPHFDMLAREGASFGLAFSQVAFCVPSRTSFLTGLRPETTRSIHNDQVKRFGVHRLAPLRPGYTVLDAFKRAGYVTAAVGKIFHFGEAHPSLDLPVFPSTHDLLGRPCDSPRARDVHVPHAHARFGFPKACQLPFGSFVDERIAAGAVGYLRRLSTQNRSFLLLVGFMRPHNPYHFPSHHLARLPAANETDVAPVRWRHGSQPALAYADSIECAMRKCSREQRRFYRGAVSHVDEMLGLVLRELETRRIARSTLVCVHADHGFSLGENGAWQKRSNFDHATRVPLLLRDPQQPHAAGLRVDHAPVELTDVLPTLLDLSGAARTTPPPRHLQGRSLRPLLVPAVRGSHAAFKHAFMLQPRLLYLSRNESAADGSGTGRRPRVLLIDGDANASDVLPNGGATAPTRPRDCSEELVPGGFGPGRACRFVAMGFSVRSRRWRYTRWERWPIDGNAARVWTVGEGALLAEELYCHGCGGAHGNVSGGADAEQINLLRKGAPPSAASTAAQLALMNAMLARRAAAESVRARACARAAIEVHGPPSGSGSGGGWRPGSVSVAGGCYNTT